MKKAILALLMVFVASNVMASGGIRLNRTTYVKGSLIDGIKPFEYSDVIKQNKEYVKQVEFYHLRDKTTDTNYGYKYTVTSKGYGKVQYDTIKSLTSSINNPSLVVEFVNGNAIYDPKDALSWKRINSDSTWESAVIIRGLTEEEFDALLPDFENYIDVLNLTCSAEFSSPHNGSTIRDVVKTICN